ncbi:MAG: hypothetical protein QXK20_03305, partial [Nitrososphaerales archaeon]
MTEPRVNPELKLLEDKIANLTQEKRRVIEDLKGIREERRNVITNLKEIRNQLKEQRNLRDMGINELKQLIEESRNV